MRASGWVLALVAGLTGVASAQHTTCRRAVIEGRVTAGQGYEQVFAPGLELMLEPVASGWMIRVLPAGQPRGPHDYAELATPPFRSVTPLAITTDYSFRAQDAAAWNPRRFRYAATAADFRRLSALYGPVMDGNAAAVGSLAKLLEAQPEGEITLLEAGLTPGTGNQARMASVVAQHGETTVQQADPGPSTPLGRLGWIRFRVELELPPGVVAPPGVRTEKILCAGQPTRTAPTASEHVSPERKR